MSDSYFFNINEDAIQDILEATQELQELANEQMSDFDVFDGMMRNNSYQSIRTGIIQDPKYPALSNRVDDNGDPQKGKYSVLDDSDHDYPFNGVNAVDPNGMRVSIVWLDGADEGFYGDASKTSVIGTPVQKLFLSFPNAWADMDRSCGDFSLPLPGTICRIGLLGDDMGVFLGAIPLDKSKQPNLRLGEMLKKHYNQNCHLLTDSTTASAYAELNKDIFKSKSSLSPKDPTNKPYETDTVKLSNLTKYAGHRNTVASDGISNSVNVDVQKHSSIDNRRTFEFNTNLSLSAAFDAVKLSLSNDLVNMTSVRIICPQGDWSIVRDETDGKFITTLNTKLSMTSALSMISSKVSTKVLHITAADGILSQTDGGNQVKIPRTGVIEILAPSNTQITTPTLNVTGDIVASGEVSDILGSMNEMRQVYNSHIHGSSPPPTPPMT